MKSEDFIYLVDQYLMTALVVQDDSFKASKALCELIKPGVAAIFGPTSSFSSNHVQSGSGQ